MFIAVVLDSTSVLDSMPALDSMSVLDFMLVSFAECAGGLPVFPFLLSMSAGKAGTREGSSLLFHFLFLFLHPESGQPNSTYPGDLWED